MSDVGCSVFDADRVIITWGGEREADDPAGGCSADVDGVRGREADGRAEGGSDIDRADIATAMAPEDNAGADTPFTGGTGLVGTDVTGDTVIEGGPENPGVRELLRLCDFENGCPRM